MNFYELGDVVPLSINITDDSGNAADAGAVTLTITLPDGTSTQPAVTHPATGSYLCNYTPTQAGHHRFRWVATGANANAYNDAFDVESAAPRFIIGLADAREALRKTPNATVDDEELRLYIAAVTPIVEDIAGPQIAETITQTAHGGRSTVLLPTAVVSVTSVTENGVLLTEGQDFVVDKAAGIIYRGTQIQPFGFIAGHDNIVVTYIAANGVIAENVRLAARIILKHLWQADNTGGGRPQVGVAAGGGGADVTVTPGGYAVPRRAVELLTVAQNVNMPGFA